MLYLIVSLGILPVEKKITTTFVLKDDDVLQQQVSSIPLALIFYLPFLSSHIGYKITGVVQHVTKSARRFIGQIAIEEPYHWGTINADIFTSWRGHLTRALSVLLTHLRRIHLAGGKQAKGYWGKWMI